MYNVEWRWLYFLLQLGNLGGNVVLSMVFVEMKTLGRNDRYLYKLKGSYFPKCLLQCQEWGQTLHPCGPKARFLICYWCSTGTFVACESTKKV